MTFAKLSIAVAMAGAVAVSSCNSAEPVRETERTTTNDEVQERTEDAADLERRANEIEQRWTKMQAEVKEEAKAPTAGLVEEVREDVTNVRQAVADLKSTTAENWWERHAQATERTIADIEADVQRFAKTGPAPAAPAPKPVGTSASFESRRDQFVAEARARLDAMEERLKGVDAEAARQTELEDTRARIDKLQDDLDRLGRVSPDDWWDVSQARVAEYIDRVERSIGRLNDDDAL